MHRSGRKNSTDSWWASNHDLTAAAAIADDHDIGIVVAGPVQLSQGPQGDEARAQRLSIS